MIMKRLGLFITINIVFFISCKTNKTSNIIGKYYVSNNINIECFELSENKGFSYSRKSIGGLMRYSNGSWSYNPKTKQLHLISKITNVKSIPISVTTKNKDSSVYFNFPNLEDPYNSLTKIKWEICINNKLYPIQTGDKSFVVINEYVKVDSFHIQATRDIKAISSSPIHSMIRSQTYKVSELTSNYFEVIFPENINVNFFCYLPIDDFFKVKGGNIIWEREGDNQIFYKIKYEKGK